MRDETREMVREWTRDFNRRVDQGQFRSSLQRLIELDGIAADPEALGRISAVLDTAGQQLVDDYPATGAAFLACARAIEEGGTP